MESNNEETPQNDAQESLVAHDSESKTSFKNETEATKKSEIKFKRSPSLESCSEDEKTVIKNSENPSKENLEQCVPSTANQIDPNSLDVSEFVQSNSKISALIVPSNAKENSILDSGNPESMTYKDELKSMEDDGLSLRNIIKKIAHLFFSTLSNTSKEKELDEIAKKELKNMMLDDQNTTENQKFKRFPVIISYPQSQRPK